VLCHPHLRSDQLLSAAEQVAHLEACEAMLQTVCSVVVQLV
jgi:hypothetical protein